MNLDYENLSQIIIERLRVAHNSKVAKIRNRFFESEHNFFRKFIRDKKVIVAGSGLGHDSFELSKYNKKVVGIELLPELLIIAERES